MSEDQSLPELTTQQLLDEVSKGHRALKVYEKGVQMLQGLVTLEQNIKEQTIANAKLKDAEKEWLAKKAAALNAVEDAGKRAGDILAQAGVEAKNISEDARKTAQNAIAEAVKTAKSTVEDAKAEAATHLEKAAALKVDNADVEAKLKGSKAELAAIKEAVAQHKEAIKKFVG